LPLHRAAWGTEKRHAETVKALLTKVSVGARSRGGKTALDMTTNKGTQRILKAHKRKGDKKESAFKVEYLMFAVPIAVMFFSWNLSKKFKKKTAAVSGAPHELASAGSHRHHPSEENVFLKKQQ
jgi:hypothetical protein